ARPRLGADELGYDPAVAERLHGRNAPDLVMLGKRGIRVRVELGELDLALARRDLALEHRPERAARPAPLGPEVDHDGQLVRALDDVGVEGLLGDVHAVPYRLRGALLGERLQPRPDLRGVAEVVEPGQRGAAP